MKYDALFFLKIRKDVSKFVSAAVVIVASRVNKVKIYANVKISVFYPVEYLYTPVDKQLDTNTNYKYLLFSRAGSITLGIIDYLTFMLHWFNWLWFIFTLH